MHTSFTRVTLGTQLKVYSTTLHIAAKRIVDTISQTIITITLSSWTWITFHGLAFRIFDESATRTIFARCAFQLILMSARTAFQTHYKTNVIRKSTTFTFFAYSFSCNILMSSNDAFFAFYLTLFILKLPWYAFVTLDKTNYVGISTNRTIITDLFFTVFLMLTCNTIKTLIGTFIVCLFPRNTR